MRFMILVKANKDSEAGVMPSTEILTAMGKFNEELVEGRRAAGGRGPAPQLKGARVRCEGLTKRTVIDGPFAETKELAGPLWLLQVKSKEEAIEWIKRSPFQEGEIEIRRGVRGRRLRRLDDARAAGAGRPPARRDRGPHPAAGS